MVARNEAVRLQEGMPCYRATQNKKGRSPLNCRFSLVLVEVN